MRECAKKEIATSEQTIFIPDELYQERGAKHQTWQLMSQEADQVSGPPLTISKDEFAETYSSGPVQVGPCRAGIFALITG